ncbi:hypothetical protein K501DRAFT_273684 [Backusella circina FSU 941]|nr:hypothetical protein K501DRAFT_273684 [Backusella circina FSU 941]
MKKKKYIVSVYGCLGAICGGCLDNGTDQDLRWKLQDNLYSLGLIFGLGRGVKLVYSVLLLIRSVDRSLVVIVGVVSVVVVVVLLLGNKLKVPLKCILFPSLDK